MFSSFAGSAFLRVIVRRITFVVVRVPAFVSVFSEIVDEDGALPVDAAGSITVLFSGDAIGFVSLLVEGVSGFCDVLGASAAACGAVGVEAGAEEGAAGLFLNTLGVTEYLTASHIASPPRACSRAS